MQLRWPDLGTDRADRADGTTVQIAGWMTAPGRAAEFLLSPEPSCCAGCPPRDPRNAIAVFADGTDCAPTAGIAPDRDIASLHR